MPHLSGKNLNQIFCSSSTQFALLLAGILLLSFFLRLIYLDNFPWGYDEGIHVLLARLLAAGYTPYSELFVSYPPLFIWSLEWPWRIWESVEAIQLLMTLYALLGVAAVGIIAFRLAGKLAGILAAIFLSTSMTYLDGSRAVMTEVPSIGMAALAVALAALYYWSHQRRWLFISGLVMSASLMLKILSPFVLGLIPMMILIHHLERRSLLQRASHVDLIGTLTSVAVDVLVWCLGLLLPILLIMFLYSVEAMYRQVIVFRIDTRTTYQEDWTENIDMLLAFGLTNPVLLITALWGAGLILLKKWRTGWFTLLWLILAAIFSLLQVPLREKHLPLLLPPLAILSGLGLAGGLGHLKQLFYCSRKSGLIVASSALTGLLLLGYVWQLRTEFVSLNQAQTIPLNEHNRMLVDYLQKFTSPDDCLITDNPTLAFYAARLVPPTLSEVSSARLRTGYLTYEELVAATETYSCQVVAPVDKRLKRTRADFVEWSKQNFIGLWLYDGGTEILLAKPLDTPKPAHHLQAKLAKQVELVGFDMVEKTGRKAEDELYVSLYWRPLGPFEQNYTIFVHVRDAANQTVMNGDHQPYDGLVPTTRWPVGRTIKETIRLDVPPDLPKGEYRVMVGMYSPGSLERLPLQQDSSGENAIILQPFYNP